MSRACYSRRLLIILFYLFHCKGARMSLFQSIIIEKYVRELDNTQLETAWQTYSHCFLNLSKQDNIRLSKEEQY